MYLSARKFLKSNNIKIDPKVLQIQRYGFSNSDENSLTGDFNTRITTAINEAGIDNFTSGGISLQKKLNDEEIKTQANEVYDQLTKAGVEVLFDDREDAKAGEKFADADLIGIPYRVVVSKRTEGKLEVKKRNESDAKILSVEEFIKSRSS